MHALPQCRASRYLSHSQHVLRPRADSLSSSAFPLATACTPRNGRPFIDQLGQLWMSGALYGKYFGLFVSTATAGGGQETTAITSLSSWVHQGMIYVPLGYAKTYALMAELNEVRGGSPWGAGTFAAGDGSRQPTQKELELAEGQGKAFWEAVSRVDF